MIPMRGVLVKILVTLSSIVRGPGRIPSRTSSGTNIKASVAKKHSPSITARISLNARVLDLASVSPSSACGGPVSFKL